MPNPTFRFSLFLLISFCTFLLEAALGQVETRTWKSTNHRLTVELLTDSLFHIEYSRITSAKSSHRTIPTSPHIFETTHPGPTVFEEPSPDAFTTAALALNVEPQSLCIRLATRKRGTPLSRICPEDLDKYWKGLSVDKLQITHFYGLGQEFRNPGNPHGDWNHQIRHYGGLHGNKMVWFNGGMNGNTQIPILYALGEKRLNYGLFLDSVYQQQWDFTSNPAQVRMYGEDVRFYFFYQDSLPELRKQFMELTGHPPVPPKKMFGFWLSEYGFRSWQHVEKKLYDLRAKHFPIDGFFLDLFWFGGVTYNSEYSSMGKLTWDEKQFPEPKRQLDFLRNVEGIGIVPIEESYVAKGLSEHQDLASKGYLVKNKWGHPAYLDFNPWWGKGGMIDWTNPEARLYWHELKRKPIVESGITALWTDLGEPEQFPDDGKYFNGKSQADIHNLYNFYWLQGIASGYATFHPNQRLFAMSRSGAAGMQRLGAGLWSGDIGADLENLAAHQNAQMHVSLSGIDYYGSDLGGFHRSALKGDLHEMYDQWFAYSALFDIPVRPHTENLCQCKETSPVGIGNLNANVNAIRRRYALIPYLYSLAHRAHRFAEPVYPPMVYYYQEEPEFRYLGSQKMIGRWLMAGTTSRYGQSEIEIRFPKERWYDFETGQKVIEPTQRKRNIKFPLFLDGKFSLPLFVKEGAIIPMAFVDSYTLNAMGKRSDGETIKDLKLRIFPSENKTSFTVFEDDGETNQYLSGGIKETLVTQQIQNQQIEITIEPTTKPDETRKVVLEVCGVSIDTINRIQVNGVELPSSQWSKSGPNRVAIVTDFMPESVKKYFVIDIKPH